MGSAFGVSPSTSLPPLWTSAPWPTPTSPPIMCRVGMSLWVTWQRWPPGHAFWRGQLGRSLHATASMGCMSRPFNHQHRILSGTSQRSLPACHDPPSGTLLLLPDRFWWNYPPPCWIVSVIQVHLALYSLWRGRPVLGSRSVLTTLVDSTRRSPGVHTYEYPIHTLPVWWEGIPGPRCHRPSWGPVIPGRGDLGLCWRAPGKDLTPL